MTPTETAATRAEYFAKPIPGTEALYSEFRWMTKTRSDAHRQYARLLREAATEGKESLRQQFLETGRRDFYFFTLYILYFQDFRFLNNDWFFRRARELQANPYGFGDFWARGHFKTILHEAFTLWDALYHPELTTAFFSMTRDQAERQARNMMGLLEQPHVQWQFPKVLWGKDIGKAPSWNTSAIFFRRNVPRKDPSIGFHSLLSLPTGAHYDRIWLDDIVDQRYVTNEDQVELAVSNIRLMAPLQAPNAKRRLTATRYDNNDAYHRLIEDGSIIPRVYPPTADGTEEGELLLFTPQDWADWCIQLGPYQVACQMFQRPEWSAKRLFDSDWLLPWRTPDNIAGMNVYIIVDPANRKGKTNDYTAIVVVALGSDGNVYVVDMVRDRLDPTERSEKIFQLAKKYRPIAVYEEESGLSADVHHMGHEMDRQNWRFPLFGLPAGGNKSARIETLQPLAKNGRLYMPAHIWYRMVDGTEVDLVAEFKRSEWTQWPKPLHDDLLDALCRVTDGSTVDREAYDINGKKVKVPQIEFPLESPVGLGAVGWHVGQEWDVATGGR